MSYFLWQLGAFFVWFAYGSFFEWWFHKNLFHSPKLIRATYEAHDRVHHVNYGDKESYDLPCATDPNGEHISMDWFALPVFVGVHFPIIFAVQWLTGIPMVWGGCLAIGVYYVMYETVHYYMHIPRNRAIERMKLYKFLNEHHRIHHKYVNKNLNVLIPLADMVMKTLVVKKRAPKSVAVAAKASDVRRVPVSSKPRA